MRILDTRDLIERRDELVASIIEDAEQRFSCEFDTYEEIKAFLDDEANSHINLNTKTEFLEHWLFESIEIEEINKIEEVITDFEHGESLIHSDDFEEYCENYIMDCGFLPKDTPSIIKDNINWKRVTDDMTADYNVVKYQGETYLGL